MGTIDPGTRAHPWTPVGRTSSSPAAVSAAGCRRGFGRHGVKAVIPRRKDQRPDDRRHRFDKPLHRKRAAVEQCVGWLKENRAVGTRFDKLAVNHLARVHLATIRRYLRAPTAKPDSEDRT